MLYDPYQQFTHVLVLAPTAEEDVPAVQSVHVHAPSESEYEPDAQSWQVPGDVAPSVPENLPARHFVHVGDPGFSEYDPAAQLTHVLCAVAPRMEEDVPAVHSVHNVAACALHEPVQLWVMDVDPSVILNSDAPMQVVSRALHS
jgi:hypothetical protein